jgi:asparagine synthetase B (glutamine-hydrolysing)
MSDVPFGVLISGGLDSSIISATLMKGLMRMSLDLPCSLRFIEGEL